MRKRHPVDSKSRLAGHVKLEPRRLLNADFSLVAGSLTLDNFTDDFGADPDLVTASQTGTDFTFVLGDGEWNGIDLPGLAVGDGTDTLTVDNSLGTLLSIFLESETTDQFNIEFGDFSFAGDLNITNDGMNPLFGSVSQQPGTSLLQAGDFLVSGAESVNLQNATNDFSFVDFDNALDVTLADANSIDIGNVDVTNAFAVTTQDSIAFVTTGSTVNSDGTLDLVATTGDITDVDDVSITVTGASSMTAGGDIVLADEAANSIDVGALATFIAGGNIELQAGGAGSSAGINFAALDLETTTGDATVFEDSATDLTSANIGGSLAITSAADITVGPTIAGGDAAFTGEAVFFDGPVAVTGNLTVDTSAADGNVTQDIDGDVMVGGTSLFVVNAGDICMTNINNDFVGAVTATGATVELVDQNALTTGVITAVDNIYLRSGANGVGALTLTGDLTTSAAMGQTLLQSDSGATQTGTITTNELIVGGDAIDVGTGIFDFDQANNVGTIASNIQGSLLFINTAPLIIGSVNYASSCGTTEAAVGAAATDKVRLNGDGLTINAAINSDVVFLESSSGATQGAAGQILAVDLLLSGNGTFDLTNPANAVTNLAAAITAGDVNYVDIDAINIAALTCDGVTIDGINVTGDVDINTSGGDLTQTAEAIVGGTTVLNAGAGDICLTDPTNDFMGVVTADASTVEIVDRNALTTGDINAVDDIYLRSGATDAGSLTLGGNLTTSAATGQTLLQSDSGATQTGTITTSELLVGGDDADEGTGIFDFDQTNNVDTIAASIVGSLILINATPLTVGSVSYVSACGTAEAATGATATDKVRLSGAGLTLNNTIDSSVVFLSSTAGVMQAATGQILATDLLLSGNGIFDLTNSANATVNLAAAIVAGDLNYVDIDAVNIASLTCDGITIDGMSVTGNVDINTSGGDLTQTAEAIIGGTTVLDAGAGDICLTDPTNDFTGVVTANASTVEIVDRNALTTGLITAVDDIYLRSGATDAGALTLNGDLTTSDAMGQTLLQSDSGVTQTGTITTNELALGGDLTDEGSGIFDLTQSNTVGTIAADIDGALLFINSVAIVVGTVNYTSDCGTTETIVGADVEDKVRIDANGITINNTIDSAVVFLESDAGITQAAAGQILATDLLLSGTGLFDLSNPANDADNLASTITGRLNYTDVDDVNVTTLDCDGTTLVGVSATEKARFDVAGISIDQQINSTTVFINSSAGATQTPTGSIFATDLMIGGAGVFDLTSTLNDVDNIAALVAGTVNFTDGDDLTVSTLTCDGVTFVGLDVADKVRLTADSITINNVIDSNVVFLDSANGVTQGATGQILTTDLLLRGLGVFDLTNPANATVNLAAGITGELNYVDVDAVNIAELTCDGITITGIDVSGNVDLNTTNGDLTQTATVIVGGTTTINSGTGDVCLTDPENDFVGVVTANAATVEIVDRNALTTGTITAIDDIYLRSGATDAGALTLNGDLTTSDAMGQTLLQSDSGVTQTGTITTNELLLGGDVADEGTGVFDLTQANTIGTLATDVVGTVLLVNTGPLIVGDLTYTSDCGTTEEITGAAATDKIRLTASGITINNTVESDVVFLESSAGLTQAAAGQILAGDLLLSGTGLFNLTNPANDADNLAALIGGTLNYTDADELTVANLTCDGVTICGLNITGDLNLTTNNGDLFQAPDPTMPNVNSAAVIVGGNVVLSTGTGDICFTGGDCDGDGINDNRFDGTLTVNSTGDVVIAENDDITIDAIGGGGSFRFIGNNIQINTAITGDQLLLEASDGVDYNGNVIDVTDLILIGTGAFDFGTLGETANSIDNLAADINGSLSLINATAIDVGNLTFVSNCGDVTVCGIDIDAGAGLTGTLELRTINADITQSAAVRVEGLTTLQAGTGDICFTGGDCDADGLNDNDFSQVIIVSADDAEIVDRNDLEIVSASVVSQLRLFAGDVDPGNLLISGNLTAGEQILLQSSGDTTQAAGVIATNDLILGSGTPGNASGGDFTLSGANDVDRLAGNVVGDLVFNSITSVEIADISYTSDCGTIESICGIDVGGTVTLTITGDLTQTGSVVIGDAADITATGAIWLTGADCDGDGLNDNDFAGVVTASAASIELVDRNDLTVGDITAVDDIYLRAGEVDLGDLMIGGNLLTSAADGQILLQSRGDTTQTAGTIRSNDLLLGSDTLANASGGDFTLGNANAVNRLAGNVGGNLVFTNTVDTEVADLTFTSVCGTLETIRGLTVGDDALLNITGNLTQSSAIVIGGTTDVTASGVVWLTGADRDGDGLNDNDFVGVVTADATSVELVDRNDLNVGDITAVDDIYLRAGDVDPGNLMIGGNLITSDANGQILLQSRGDTTQTAGTISTNDSGAG